MTCRLYLITPLKFDLPAFAEELNSIKEGDGTLLDHSLIFAHSECGLATNHSIENLPILFQRDELCIVRVDRIEMRREQDPGFGFPPRRQTRD